ncbi:MAG: type II toxin-antitoxin system RelE/ParE family toxin [Alphaproteobacteria bacterium]|nr:type II toxin-antitoxin system RelE/ParE family toxin [Alphaproteobacteria bacterium]MBV9378245.1 type II toxin-antitoxin system RelE/ParE family toxin [Alphaproteobacteria bacterium]
MRIFKTRWLVRYARRQRIGDASLREAIERAGRGLIDADLGGGIIKQRVARAGQGRSGGHRMLVAYRAGSRAVFLYAFAKNERDNIDPDELLTLREIGAAWLAADAQRITDAIGQGILQEVVNEDQET